MIYEEFGSEKKLQGLQLTEIGYQANMIFNKEFNFHETEGGAYERREQVKDL